jgi:hypothetical protein
MSNKKIDRSQIYLDVAKLHIDCLKTGFLPSLGVKFLALMYRCIDEENFSTLILKYKDYKLIGFVSGTLGTSSLFRAILHHPIDLILALIPLIFNIKIIKKMINILRYMSGSERNKYPKAELLTICVQQDYRQQGIAIDLYQKLSLYFQSSSISEFIIIVGQSLKANSFYRNQGADLVGELQVHQDVNSNIFIQKI